MASAGIRAFHGERESVPHPAFRHRYLARATRGLDGVAFAKVHVYLSLGTRLTNAETAGFLLTANSLAVICIDIRIGLAGAACPGIQGGE